MTLTGDVIAISSHWTADGSRIVSEAVVATATGPITVSQLGGTVGELTMRQWPADAMLEPGMRVSLDVRDAPDLGGRMHAVVDHVKVWSRAPGFVRTGLTKGNHSLYWESGCVYVAVAAEGTKDIVGDVEFPVVSASIETWNTAPAACSYFTTIEDAPLADHEVGRDNVNLIKFRDQSWCRPATADDPARCYASTAAGLTTAVYVDSASSDRDGAIVDADIELNGVNFDLGTGGVTLGTSGCIADLANTLTHELGHLHGLEHTCRTSTDPDRVDDHGHPVPLCSATSDPDIVQSTMYPFQDCGETKKATLEQDELDAMCGIYPTAKDPGSCSRVTDSTAGCCGTSRRPGGALLLVGLIASILARPRGRMFARRR
ncbi:MAG: hypothetical protein NT062_37955, partial [Proteobacteria bacterium]|nr:hypothetical protein [Pseudomonadota bacterium]